MKRILVLTLICAMVLSMMVPAGAVFASSEMENYSVLFNTHGIPADFEETLEAAGATLTYAVPEIGFAQISAPANAIGTIKGLKTVQVMNPSATWALPEGERLEATTDSVDLTEDAALWERQWDIKRITENGASYDLGTGSHNTIIGIVDTGIDRDHPDLVGNLLPGSKNFVPAGGFRGQEPSENGDINAFDDKHGHGTHCAGSIAANGAMLGVAPDVGIRSYRVFGTSSAESAWIIDAMITAANDGVDVLSMSLGGFDLLGQAFYTDPVTGEKEKLGNDVADFKAYMRAVKYVQEKDVVIVVAAGNDGIDCANKNEVTAFLNAEYGGDGLVFKGAGFNVPAVYPNIVTVSATDPNDELAGYSNYGPGFIDIAAPGGNTEMYYQYLEEGRFDEYLAKKLYYNEFCLSTGEAGDYYYSIGTSMAAPKVSAVAGLLADQHPELSANEIAKMLTTAAVDPVSGTAKKYFGNGFLNAAKALAE